MRALRPINRETVLPSTRAFLRESLQQLIDRFSRSSSLVSHVAPHIVRSLDDLTDAEIVDSETHLRAFMSELEARMQRDSRALESRDFPALTGTGGR